MGASESLRQTVKRALDLALTVPALVLLAPGILAVYLAIRRCLGKPALFRQVRAGKLGQPFTLLKFRTMSEARDQKGNLLPDIERTTPLGRFLRATSLDELPQLWNVVRGDMSLIGPRPLPMAYLPRYTSRQARRHEVLPGITGWTQVNGRNTLAWEEKFALDLWYVENWSLTLDLRILYLTFWSVCRREGINHSSQATMPEFLGSGQSAGCFRKNDTPGHSASLSCWSRSG